METFLEVSSVIPLLTDALILDAAAGTEAKDMVCVDVCVRALSSCDSMVVPFGEKCHGERI